jgi:hypothetical protein
MIVAWAVGGLMAYLAGGCDHQGDMVDATGQSSTRKQCGIQHDNSATVKPQSKSHERAELPAFQQR